MSSDGASQTQNDGQGSRTVNAKAIWAIGLTVVALAFVFSNVGPATLHFLFLRFTMPAWAWFLTILVAGVVIGSLFPWFRPRKPR